MRLVRQADESDFERIIEIEKSAFLTRGSVRAKVREHFRCFPAGVFVDWKSRGYLMSILIDKHHDLFDFEHCSGADYLYITSVAVAPGEQGKGVGTRLINTALEHFKLPGLLCVAPENTGAARLYRNLGFRKCGTVYRFFYDETGKSYDGNVMRQPLTKKIAKP